MLLSLNKKNQKFLQGILEEVDKQLLIDGKYDEHGELFPIIKQLKELEY